MIMPTEIKMGEKGLKYIDFHTHVLPQIDDGSRGVDESLRMLTISKEYGVERIVATPHFYPSRERPESFFKRRDDAVTMLAEAVKENGETLPTVCIGAEVAFFDGISGCRFIEQLCVEGTNTILVEMPMDKWSQSTFTDFMRIRDRGLTPVIAHAERCLPMQSVAIKRLLFDENIVLQVNSEVFLKLGARRFAASLLREGYPIVLGSDCHDLGKRAPDLGKAVEVISKKLGEKALVDMTGLAEKLLCGSVGIN